MAAMVRTKQFDKHGALDEAMQLFWERGYHATSIQDLVDRLGVNRQSLYDTFGGKDQLFLSALERYREIQTYSTGMKQRIRLAQALIHAPAIVFLDEPTSGLDPEGRDRMLELQADAIALPGDMVLIPLPPDPDRPVEDPLPQGR